MEVAWFAVTVSGRGGRGGRSREIGNPKLEIRKTSAGLRLSMEMTNEPNLPDFGPENGVGRKNDPNLAPGSGWRAVRVVRPSLRKAGGGRNSCRLRPPAYSLSRPGRPVADAAVARPHAPASRVLRKKKGCGGVPQPVVACISARSGGWDLPIRRFVMLRFLSAGAWRWSRSGRRS